VSVDPFHSTVWTRILEAQRGKDDAVCDLVLLYRAPLLRWVRAQGLADADAEDVVQEVFLRLVSRDVLGRADRERGRFRAFLLGVAKNVVREERERRGAKKRGGGARSARLSDVYDLVPAPVEADPEWNSLWSDHLLERALDALSRESPRLHEALSLRFQQELSHKDIAARMDRTIQQVKNDLHRARLKLVERIKADIAAYASSPEEVEEETAAFLAWLGGR
jgi:RNA polymerase sigma factor (sigma-70 family)